MASRFAALGGTPVSREYSRVAAARSLVASACACGGASDEITASAHNAPAAEARASRAPSSLIGVLVSIALVYSQHNCDARGSDYTVPQITSGMSQSNDVAKGRHFRYYLARGLPARQSASLITACTGLKDYLSCRVHADSLADEKTANGFRVS